MKVIVTPGFVIYFTWESTWILSVLKKYQSFSNYVFQWKHSVVRNTHIYISYTYVVPTIQTVSVAFYV